MSHVITVELLPDDEVVAMSEQQLSDAEQSTLSDLLTSQREGTLSTTDRIHLDTLLHTYRIGMVRKAQALTVAIARGLRPPVSNS